MTINMFPDQVLLEIFDTRRKMHDEPIYDSVWGWLELVHVCQRWRQLIFGSPRGLDLQILCTHGTPVRESLDIWPPLPIAVHYHYDKSFTPYDANNLLAALDNPGRLRRVDLYLTRTQLAEVATVMQQPLPKLTHFSCHSVDDSPPPLSDGFLGGSTPCLQELHMGGIAYPALPTLLLSARGLVHLSLGNIPPSGYIPPESLVTCLATLPKLQSFDIEYFWTTSDTNRPPVPPVTRSLLPALTFFGFQGHSDYLEDLVSWIDSPRLNRLGIDYVNSLSQPEFQFPQLFKFIDRSEDPDLCIIKHADIIFSPYSVDLEAYPCLGSSRESTRVIIMIECEQIEDQVFYVSQMFNQPSAMLSRVVHLKLKQSAAEEDHHIDEWLQLLRLFSTVRTLHVSREFSKGIALALEHATGEMAVEALPVVDLIFLQGQPSSCITNFLMARQLFGVPVTVVDRQAEFNERVRSYFD